MKYGKDNQHSHRRAKRAIEWLFLESQIPLNYKADTTVFIKALGFGMTELIAYSLKIESDYIQKYKEIPILITVIIFSSDEVIDMLLEIGVDVNVEIFMQYLVKFSILC